MMPNGHLGTFRQRDGIARLWASCMPMFGMKTPRMTFVAIVTGMPYSYSLIAQAKDGVYRFGPVFDRGLDRSDEDIAVEFHTLTDAEANYAGMARVYRKYQLDRNACVPLRERIKHSPELAYAARCPEVRIRQGWKPVPSPVPEQTVENEPPMRVMVTFDRVGDILDEFQRQGVDAAEIRLVGWNQKGHDGRWPQIFPVEESLGGEGEAPCGHQEGPTDGLPDRQSREPHRCLPDCQLLGCRVHPQELRRYAPPRQDDLGRRAGLHDLRPGPTAVCREGHPHDRRSGLPGPALPRRVHLRATGPVRRPAASRDGVRRTAFFIDQIMKLGKETFGGVASEGPYDFCCGNLDSVLYVSFDKPDQPMPKMVDRCVPIWQLVYNGIILSTPFTTTVNYTTQNRVAQLKLIEFNGRPVFYFYSRFKDDGKN